MAWPPLRVDGWGSSILAVVYLAWCCARTSNFFINYLFPNNALISVLMLMVQQTALLEFLPTTLCCVMIRTHMDLHQTGTFEGRYPD